MKKSGGKKKINPAPTNILWSRLKPESQSVLSPIKAKDGKNATTRHNSHTFFMESKSLQ